MNSYRCFACDETQMPEFSGWVCPACGGNLDVMNDYDTILEQIRQSPFDDSRIPLRHRAAHLCTLPNELGQSIGLRNLYPQR